MKKSSVHSTKGTNIQIELKENSAHNTKVINIQLEVKENSAQSTNEQTFYYKWKKIVRTTLK